MRKIPQVFAAAAGILLSLPVLTSVAVSPLRAEDKTPAQQQPASTPAKPPAPAQAKPATPPPPPPAPKTVLDNKQVIEILGKEVLDAANEKMGRIIDVLVDHAGIVRAAIIDFGGFLGVGSRKIAVDWNALHFGMGKDHTDITLALTRDQVKAAPQFEEGKPITVLGAVGSLPQVTSKTPER
jgi:hypothetical protein